MDTAIETADHACRYPDRCCVTCCDCEAFTESETLPYGFHVVYAAEPIPFLAAETGTGIDDDIIADHSGTGGGLAWFGAPGTTGH